MVQGLSTLVFFSMLVTVVFFSLHYSFITGHDFLNTNLSVTIPNNTVEFFLPMFLSIVDDEVNEAEEGFALVAVIGDDVPENIACFEMHFSSFECTGRNGAAGIWISDNDG